MKKLILLSSALCGALFAASLISGLPARADDASRGVPSRAGGPTRPTETALGCMLGFYERQTCVSLFTGNASLVTFNQVNRWLRPDPYFQTARFDGVNRAGEEIWDVKFRYRENTYVIAPPAPDGKIRKVTILVGPPRPACTNLVGALSPGEVINAACLY
ncbi:MAG TPA: hypothetical protein VN685_00380 [Rhizomicrobium sp.]|jgi:hypothetical protein|nr:hypothetical protein [Rhizomicrobium sp.]